jgi:uncharacterized membrane protein YphA (DoxX/SURF4 family)
VALALLILTQTALPLCGALLFGTWLYLFRWGWMVACDATPLLAVAIVYASSPWQSHTLAITDINQTQMRWVRLTLGFGFLTLGWLKVFNHNLVAGVGDNYPAIMDDPMINLFRLGTDPAYRRETWIIAFGLAEVLSGFLVMFGCFTRIWCSLMAFLFTKLMLIDFGWDEIPHVAFIGAVLAVATSNRLTSEFDPIEALEERAGRAGKTGKQAAIILGPSLLVAFAVIFPLLFFITFFDRSKL